MPPMHSEAEGVGGGDGGELFEIRHHLQPLNIIDHHQSHYPSFVEEINAILHYTPHSSVHNSANGSHTGSGALSGSSGQGITDDSYHFLVACALIVPLVITVGAIFLIALIVRRMRRSESLKEIVGRNEFVLKDFSTSPSASEPPSVSTSPSPSTSSSISLQRVIGHRSTSDLSHSLPSSSPSSRNSSPPTTPSHQFQFNPPWFLYSTSYYRSQYNLNKLQHEMSAYYVGSMQSLPTNQQSLSSSLSPYIITEPLDSPQDGGSLSATEDTTNSSNKSNLKRSSSNSIKRFKKVFRIMNFPKRIRQHNADKNRFNVYTVPMETREQLKQIYVY